MKFGESSVHEASYSGPNWSVLIQFLLVMLIASAHHLVPLVSQNGDYTPFSIGSSNSVFDESQFYTPGPMQFYQTGTLGETDDVFERRTLPSIYPFLHSVIIGSTAKLLGGLERAWVFLHALLPALTWLVTWLLLGEISEQAWIRAAGAWGLVFVGFGPKFGLLLSHMAFIEPPDIIRLPQPALSALLFLTALLSLRRVLQKDGVGAVFTAGILGGTLFYAYYFYCMTFLGAVGVLILRDLLLRRAIQARRLGFVLIISLGIGTPYLINAFLTKPLMHWILLRQGVFSHRPHLVGILLAGVAASLFFLKPKDYWRELYDKNIFLMLLAVFVAGCLAMNSQILTGFDAQHITHFRVRVLQPFGWMIVFVVAVFVVQRELSFKNVRFLGIIFTALFATLPTLRQILVGRNTARAHLSSNPTYQTLEWIREHFKGRRTVFGTNNGELIALIPGISGQWTFVPSNGRTGSSDEEILSRYIILSRILGFSMREIGNSLVRLPPALMPWHCLSYILFGVPPEVDRWSENVLKKEFSKPLTESLKQRRLDYLILEPALRQHLDPLVTARAEKIYEGAQWEIVKLAEARR